MWLLFLICCVFNTEAGLQTETFMQGQSGSRKTTLAYVNQNLELKLKFDHQSAFESNLGIASVIHAPTSALKIYSFADQLVSDQLISRQLTLGGEIIRANRRVVINTYWPTHYRARLADSTVDHELSPLPGADLSWVISSDQRVFGVSGFRFYKHDFTDYQGVRWFMDQSLNANTTFHVKAQHEMGQTTHTNVLAMGLNYKVISSPRSKQHPRFAIRDVDIVFGQKKRYEFIHVPKTGGQSLRRFMTQVKHPQLINVTQAHVRTAKDIQDDGLDAIAVIREPLDRFESAVNYWRSGSNTIKLSARQTKTKTMISSMQAFVNALRDPEHALHQMAWSVMRTGDPDLRNIEGYHFDKQVSWINGDMRRTHLICFDQDRLKDNIEAKLKQLGIKDLNFDQFEMRNVTKQKIERVKDLSEENTLWLKNYYKEDIQLYKNYCQYRWLPGWF